MRFTLRQLFVSMLVIAIPLGIVSCSMHLKTLRPVYSRILFVAFSPDGKSLAIHHYRARHAGIPRKGFVENVSNTVAQVDVANLSNVTVVHHEFDKSVQGSTEYRPRVVAFGHTGTLDVLDEVTQTLRSWDIASGKSTTSNIGDEYRLYDGILSPESEFVRISRVPTAALSSAGSPLPILIRLGQLGVCVPWQDSKHFFMPARKGVQVWDIAAQKVIRRLHENCDELDHVTCLAISPDGDTIAFSCYEGLRLCRLQTGKERVLVSTFVEFIHLPNGGHGVRSNSDEHTTGVAFSPDGKLLAAWGAYGLKFFDMTQSAKLQRSVPFARILCLAFSPDGKTFATGDGNGKLTILDVATGTELRSRTF